MKKIKSLMGVLLLTSFSTGGSLVNAEVISTPEVASVQSLDITDPTAEVSDILTFEEITKEISKDFGISLAEAENMVVENNANKSISSARAATYRTLSQQFTVTTTYKPTMRFYCQTSESGLFHGILEILSVNMVRGYNGISKQFSGTVYVNLERGDRIFYIVNGDFYNQGTTTFDGRINIGLGESNSVGFGVSHASNHYAYRYIESHFNW